MTRVSVDGFASTVVDVGRSAEARGEGRGARQKHRQFLDRSAGTSYCFSEYFEEPGLRDGPPTIGASLIGGRKRIEAEKWRRVGHKSMRSLVRANLCALARRGSSPASEGHPVPLFGKSSSDGGQLTTRSNDSGMAPQAVEVARNGLGNGARRPLPQLARGKRSRSSRPPSEA